jgi:hypothetical protein
MAINYHNRGGIHTWDPFDGDSTFAAGRSFSTFDHRPERAAQNLHSAGTMRAFP